MEARNYVGIGFSYWPARLHSLTELVHWNRFLGSLKVLKFGLSIVVHIHRIPPFKILQNEKIYLYKMFTFISIGRLGQHCLDNAFSQNVSNFTVLWIRPDQRGQCILFSVVFTPSHPSHHGARQYLGPTYHLSTPNG
jgi:hypothetical protein